MSFRLAQNKKRPTKWGRLLNLRWWSQQIILRDLEDISDEVVTPVVPTWRWVVVVPSLVVNRDPHLSWIAMVQAVGTTVVLVTPVVLRVRYVRVVVETVEVLRSLPGSPTGSITFFLRLAGFATDQSQRDGTNGNNANLTNHGDSSVGTAKPPELS